MGMDVYGRAPKSEVGTYFRANVWMWRPIHDLIVQANVLTPKMLEAMEYNDGAGPNDEQAMLLSYQLEQMVEGMDDANTFMLNEEIDGPIAYLLKAIGDSGAVVSAGPVYSVEVEVIREFIEFCRESGGFEVC